MHTHAPMAEHSSEVPPSGDVHRRLRALYASVFLDSVCFNMLTAVTPAMLLSLEGSVRQTTTMLARMSSLSAAVEFFLNPAFGRLSDRLGRRTFLFLSPAAVLLLRGVVVLRPSAALVVLGHVLCAALGGRYGGNAFMNAGALPMVNDLVASTHGRAENLARLTSFAGLGAMLGPAAGAKLSQLGPRLPFTLAALLAAANLLLLSATVPESRDAAAAATTKQAEGVSLWRCLLRSANPLSFLALFNPRHRYNRRTGGAVARIATVLALQSTSGGLEEVREVYARQRLGWGAMENGICRSLEGVENIICGSLCGPMLTRLGPWLNTRVGNWMNACSLVGMGLSRSTGMLYTAQLPGAALVCAAATKSSLACYADAAGVGQGEFLGHQSSLLAALKILTPLIYGRAFTAFSDATSLGSGGAGGSVWQAAPFLLGGASFILSDLVTVSLLRPSDFEKEASHGQREGDRSTANKVVEPGAGGGRRGRWAAGMMSVGLGIVGATQLIS